MPCRDYESDYSSNWDRERYKAQTDKLARIACAAMEELVKQGKADFLVLRNEEVREWWEAHVEADRKEKARIAEIERKARVREEALARLSDEEKELLGLTKKKRKAVVDPQPIPNYKLDINRWEDPSDYVEDMVEDLKEQYLKVFQENKKRY